MKKIRLILFVAFIGIASYGSYYTYQYAMMSENERFLLANIEALTSGEGADGECPKGGYWSTGKRAEDIKRMWAKIEISTGITVSLSDSQGSASPGFSMERVNTVAYNCDGGSGVCLVCNRYVLN